MFQEESKSGMKTESEPKREPRALSTEYHKARKQLMLWAGILFIWELVGIDLEKAKEAGGNFGAIIGAIKSPQAVPWTLLILVGYFLFKLTIEWYQCNPNRRAIRVARIDFLSAWIVSIMAFILYIGQAASRVQFADLLQASGKALSLTVGLASGIGLGGVLVRLWVLRRQSPKRLATVDYIYLSLTVLPVLIAALVRRLSGYPFSWAFCLIGLGIGALLVPGILVAVDRPRRSWESQPEEQIGL